MSETPGPSRGEPSDDAYDRLRRRVLWSLPTGLFVVGSQGHLDGAQRYNLMTANLVMQVATEPKLVAVALERASLTRRLAESGGGFAISVLRREDRAIVRRFVKPVADVSLGPDGTPVQMAGHAVHCAPSGAPILEAACAWLDCALRSLQPLGSHHLAIGEVVGVEGPPEGETVEVLRMEDTRMNYGG